MPRVAVTLPDHLHKFVNGEVAAGKGRVSASDFIVQQISRAYDESHQGELEKLLLEGLNSGPAVPFTRKDWASIRKEGKRRLAAQRKKHGTSRKKARSRS